MGYDVSKTTTQPTTTTTDLLGNKEIRSSTGELIGYEDVVRGKSRRATELEKKTDIYKQAIKVKPTIEYETKRYENIGYSANEAKKLATESIKQGGVTYTPTRAKEIIKDRKGGILSLTGKVIDSGKKVKFGEKGETYDPITNTFIRESPTGRIS